MYGLPLGAEPNTQTDEKEKSARTSEDNGDNGNASWRFDSVKESLLIFLGVMIVS